MLYLSVSLISLLVSFFFLKVWIPIAKKIKITGKDVQKPEKPEIPEMGGIVTAISLFFVSLIYLFFKLYTKDLNYFKISEIEIIFFSIAIISLIGMADDIQDLGQKKKTLLSLLAGIPISFFLLKSPMKLSFLGIDTKTFYIFLAPFIISGASNAFNMLAGFNGLETGMMSITSITLSLIAWHKGDSIITLVLLSFFASSLALWWFNKYPSKVFVGDTGLMSTGTILAIAAMLGGLELPALIIFIPYFIDFSIKLPHKLPKTFGIYKNGKLYPPKDGPKGLGQWVMKIFNGISEKNLTRLLLAFETIFCLLAIWLAF